MPRRLSDLDSQESEGLKKSSRFDDSDPLEVGQYPLDEAIDDVPSSGWENSEIEDYIFSHPGRWVVLIQFPELGRVFVSLQDYERRHRYWVVQQDENKNYVRGSKFESLDEALHFGGKLLAIENMKREAETAKRRKEAIARSAYEYLSSLGIQTDSQGGETPVSASLEDVILYLDSSLGGVSQREIIDALGRDREFEVWGVDVRLRHVSPDFSITKEAQNQIEIRHRTTGKVLRVVEGANLKGANLEGANLEGADLEGADLSGADLSGASLEGADLRDADLEGANLSGADLEGAWLWDANLKDARLSGANLSGASLDGANLESASLEGANLSGARLWRASLSGANFKDASLKDANLRGANLSGANLEGANLEGTILEGTEYDTEGWDSFSIVKEAQNQIEIRHRTTGKVLRVVEGASLVGVRLQDANLRGADLSGANLEGANLEGAWLESANLRDASLSSANLWGADLSGADLEGANLEGANLKDADLEGANLKGANLKGTILEGTEYDTGSWASFLVKEAQPEIKVGDFAIWGRSIGSSQVVKVQSVGDNLCQVSRRRESSITVPASEIDFLSELTYVTLDSLGRSRSLEGRVRSVTSKGVGVETIDGPFTWDPDSTTRELFVVERPWWDDFSLVKESSLGLRSI